MIEHVLREWLSGVLSAAAGVAGFDVFPVYAQLERAQQPAPYAAYRRLPTRREYTLDGRGAMITPVHGQFRVTVWAETYDKAAELSAALIEAAALLASDDESERVEIPEGMEALFVIADSDVHDPNLDLMQIPRYGRAVDFTIVYDE